MALSVATNLEVRTTGNDTNGGGFVAGASGTDWSQQDAAQYSVTDGVTAGTTTITSATANFGTDVVGNIMYVQGGTGGVTAGWYQIMSRSNSTTIVVDRSTGLTAGTGVTLKIGGALATPGQAAGVLAGIIGTAWVKASGTYTITVNTNNVANGKINTTSVFLGYTTTRGDMGKFTFDAGAITGATMFAGDGAIVNCIFLGNGNASLNARGATNGSTSLNNSSGRVINCEAYDVVVGFDAQAVVACYVENCSSRGICARYSVSNSFARDCAYGFEITGSGISQSAMNCVALDCTSSGFRVYDTGSGGEGASLIGCSAYSCHTGFLLGSTSEHPVFVNCVSINNTQYGFYDGARFVNCAAYGNGIADFKAVTTAHNAFLSPAISLSADPFVDATNGDFSLNDTTGGGAELRAAGHQVYGQAGFRDVGAVQISSGAAGTVAFASIT